MARQFDNLFPDIIEFENLLVANRFAAKGKRSGVAAASFEYALGDELITLRDELASKSYRPGGYYSFRIRDPKPRLISAAPFRDRVVHHALCQVIEPLFERTFIGDSYANHIGKGTHAALNRAQGFARRYRYVLQCDVRQFFASIDHEILYALITQKITDEDVRWLTKQIIDSGVGLLCDEYTMKHFPGDDLLAITRPRGLPIGNLTSQFWANVYLNELDQFVKRELRCKAYLRYVDDFLLLSNSKAELWVWKRAIVDKLATLRLTLHERSSTVYPVKTGIPFLGFRTYPERRQLKRRNGVNFERRLHRLYNDYENGDLTRMELAHRIQGWVAHANGGDTWGLQKRLLLRPLPQQHPDGVTPREPPL